MKALIELLKNGLLKLVRINTYTTARGKLTKKLPARYSPRGIARQKPGRVVVRHFCD